MAAIHSKDDILSQILNVVTSLQADNKHLSESIATLTDRVNKLTIQTVIPDTDGTASPSQPAVFKMSFRTAPVSGSALSSVPRPTGTPSVDVMSLPKTTLPMSDVAPPRKSLMYSSRIILTTYFGQSGIDPVVMNWGESDPQKRGPVVVSRSVTTVRRRNGMCSFSLYFSFDLSKNAG